MPLCDPQKQTRPSARRLIISVKLLLMLVTTDARQVLKLVTAHHRKRLFVVKFLTMWSIQFFFKLNWAYLLISNTVIVMYSYHSCLWPKRWALTRADTTGRPVFLFMKCKSRTIHSTLPSRRSPTELLHTAVGSAYMMKHKCGSDKCRVNSQRPTRHNMMQYLVLACCEDSLHWPHGILLCCSLWDLGNKH